MTEETTTVQPTQQISVIQALQVCEGRLAQSRFYQEASLLKGIGEYVAKLEEKVKELTPPQVEDATVMDAAE